MRAPVEPTLVDLRLLLPAAATWAGVAVGLGVSPGTAGTGCGVVAVVGLLGLARRAWTFAAAAVCLALALLSCTLHLLAWRTGVTADLARSGAAVRVEVVLAGDPVLHAAKVVGAGRGQDLVVVRAALRQVDARGQRWQVDRPVVVISTDTGWLGLLPGQRVASGGRLQAPKPGDEVAAVLSASGGVTLVGEAPWHQRVAGRLRDGLREAATPLPAAEAGLLPGLVVGDTSGLDPDVAQTFRDTGLTHLVAVSGANVAILLACILVVARRARVPLWAVPPLALLALLGFVVLARPSPSVLRAAATGVIALLALATGRTRQGLGSLCAAVVVLLVAKPDLARDYGFALSVLATAGLLVLAPGWGAALSRRWGRWGEALALPLAAQAACGPVIAMLTGTVSLTSIPANLLAEPAVPLATIAGTSAALVAPLSPQLAKVLAWVAEPACWWLVHVAGTGAALPGSRVPWLSGRSGAVVLALVTVLVVAGARRRVSRWVMGAACVASVLALTVVVPLVSPAWPGADWRLVVCDVGQGDALLLRGGPAGDVVVDTGPDPARLEPCLQAAGVHRVALLVLTHLHADHTGGLTAVLGRRPVGAIVVGPLREPASEDARVRQAAERAHVGVSDGVPGEVWTDGPLTLTALGPGHAFHGTDSDPNNSSLVLLAGWDTGGGDPVTALLSGDVEHEAQKELQPLVGHVDVLKVPHHGSDRQEPAFLAAASPEAAFTSVGEGNPYGHPSAKTMATLAQQGAQVLRTDTDGGLAVLVPTGTRAVTARPQHGHHDVPTPTVKAGAVGWCGPGAPGAAWASGDAFQPEQPPPAPVPHPQLPACVLPGAPTRPDLTTG